MNNKIFIQIASYRDPQLLPTIQDCLENAKHPENLIFCIAWQHSKEDTWDHLNPYVNDKRFKILDIDSSNSKGTCWARSQIQKHYNGEKYTLQLDSHHRFIKNWDTELIDMYQKLLHVSSKPLITTYLPSYKLDKPRELWLNKPTAMYNKKTDKGIPVFYPKVIEETEEPIPGFFYSGHFAFTQGAFTQEVPHDPRLYFIGEEYTISVRSFTWGYDIFYPNKVIAWHQYTREGRNKHWSDHKNWYFKDHESRRLIRKMFSLNKERIPYQVSHGFGPIRTVAEYEKKSGIKPDF